VEEEHLLPCFGSLAPYLYDVLLDGDVRLSTAFCYQVANLSREISLVSA